MLPSAPSVISLLTLLLCSIANAGYTNGYYFLNPPPWRHTPGNTRHDDTFIEGQVLHVQWIAPKTSKVSVSLFQSVANSTGEKIFPNWVSGLYGYPWIVKTSANLTLSDRFYFELYTQGSPAPVATSRQIKIAAAVESSSSVSPAATPTDGAQIASGSNAPPTSTSTSTQAADGQAGSAPSSSSSSGLSMGAKIGVGVGVGVGGLAVILAVVFFLCVKKRRKSTDDKASTNEPALLPNNHPADPSSNVASTNGASLTVTPSQVDSSQAESSNPISAPTSSSEMTQHQLARTVAENPRELENPNMPVELPGSEQSQS